MAADLTVQRTLTINYPEAVYGDLVGGLAHRFGFKEGEALPARTDAHRRHATYKREEAVQPNGQTMITETWQPTMDEFAHDAVITMLWTEAKRGLLEKAQKDLDAIKQSIDKDGLVTIVPAA